MQHKPKMSVIIPVYNESGNVKPLAGEISNALARYAPYEVIFVDDCSTDDTLAEISRVVSEDGAVGVCKHEKNRGQSASVRTGVLHASADVIAVLDGDGQNDPNDIPKLFDQLISTPGISLVIGERQNRQDAWIRKLSSKVANSVRSRVLGDGIRDAGCGLKVFYRDEFLNLPAFDHMHRFLPALLRRDGREICSVPVSHRPRTRGDSKYGVNNRLWVGIVDMLGVIWLKRRRL